MIVIKPKVVLVCMFEPKSSVQGEFGLFKEREGLKPLDLPGLEAWVSEDGQLVGMVAGVGTANTAISIMTLGSSDAIDLTEAYWMIAGIAGGNPNLISMGSPVWADWCVDGDLAFEVDAREIPEGWSTGILPLGATEPYGSPAMSPELFGKPYQVFELNPALVKKALELSSDVELADSPQLAAYRGEYSTFPRVLEEPALKIGSSLSAARFWHGPLHNAWAEAWVKHWTRGKGAFYTSAMEDTGTLAALGQLDALGRTDSRKVLVLRTVSNFTMPLDGGHGLSSLTGDSHGDEFPGQMIALENSYRVASRVFRSIIEDQTAWDGLLGE